jgi:hypothetical protein
MGMAGGREGLFARFWVAEMEKSAACRSRQRFIECDLARTGPD